MSGEATQVLAAFAAALRYEDLPPAVVTHCKTVLIDALACALAGHQGEETHQVMALAAALGPSAEASVLGGDRLSLAGSTLLNAFLITAVTMCDSHRPTMSHITPEVVPVALGIAERDDASGRDLLVALAAGFETATRVGIGLDYPKFRAKGWHSPGVIGPFGAAAAAGRLRGFTADTMAKAFGLAGSQAAGTFAAWGTPTVKFHQCRGALAGLMAGLLAEQQFLATREFLTHRDGGLYNTYAEGGRPDAVKADLGKRFELAQIALRLWPSASQIQGMNTALFDLVERNRIDFARVQAIRIALSPWVFDLHGGFPTWHGKFEAMLSAHYTAAVIVHDRALTLTQFEPARYDDPELRRAAATLVTVTSDAALTGVAATAEIEMSDGARLVSRCVHPRGAPENPLSRAEIEGKFRTYAPARLAEPEIEAVIAAVDRLENFGSVRDLMTLLRAGEKRELRRVGKGA